MMLQKGDYCRVGTTYIIIKRIGLGNVIDEQNNIHPTDTVIRISRSPVKMLNYLKTTAFWDHRLQAVLDAAPYVPPEAWTQVWRKIAYILPGCTVDKVIADKVSSIVMDKEVIPDTE